MVITAASRKGEEEEEHKSFLKQLNEVSPPSPLSLGLIGKNFSLLPLAALL